MSVIRYDPDDWEIEHHSSTCEFHRQHPGQTYAGCCCYGAVTYRPKPKEQP